ncbi:anthrax toxin receptor-like isoform X1 [Callorhinus ursinus]
MGSRSLGLPCPALFLLLVLRPPLLRAGSFLQTVQSSEMYDFDLDTDLDPEIYDTGLQTVQNPGNQNTNNQHHHLRPPEKVPQPNSNTSHNSQETLAEESKNCRGEFDLYFLLDKSGSVNNNWMDIHNMVEDLVNKFDNPNLRVSFITFSTDGHTLMKLTSDRNEIRESLAELQNIVPSGATNMQEGFKKANEQIKQANTREKKTPSIIFALTDGTLLPQPYGKTKSEAEKAQKLGAIVFCIGVKDYMKNQLLDIADSPDHVFGVDDGFKGLRNIIGKLVAKSCMDITKVEPSSFCAGENYELNVTGTGFNNARNKNEVICRFIFSENKFFDKKAASVEDTTMMCPGETIDNPDQVVFIEVSLNNGINFISNGANITSKNCVSARNAPEETPVPVPAVSPPTEPPPPPSKTYLPDINPLCLALLLPALFLILSTIWCIWRCCSRREPVRKCIQPCPTMIVPCGCQDGGIRRIEGKLDTLCDFVQTCNQVPLMWCQPRNKGRFFNFTLVKSPCRQLPCCPKICLPPTQTCFPLNSCCSQYQHSPPMCSRVPSRMLPLVSPPTRAVCGTTLSLPSP